MKEIAGKKVTPLVGNIHSSRRGGKASQGRKRHLRKGTEEHFQVARPRKTVLVVEDDRDFAKLLWEVLRHKYHVIVAFDGLEAIEAYLEERRRIDLIITGLGMPVICGDQLIDRVRNVDLEVPIIVLSGFYEGLERLKNRDDLVTMQKPFIVRDLEDAIQNCFRK